jgi:hypothetical protein
MVLALVVAGCGAVCWGLHSRAPKRDGWHFIQPEIALGTLTKDRVVPVTFELVNDSDVPVQIASVEPSCRCTTLESAPDVIPAHGTGEFKFTFVAERTDGPVVRAVTIEAGDGRTIDGTFTATVEEGEGGATPR